MPVWNTPRDSDSGILGTMGITHLLGGGHPGLSGLGPRQAPLSDDHLVLFGFDPAELDAEQWTTLTSRRLAASPAPTVRANPAATADRAWAVLAERTSQILLHIDVDVLDTGLFPWPTFLTTTASLSSRREPASTPSAASPSWQLLSSPRSTPTTTPDGHLLTDLAEVVANAVAV